jgi:hypothetical protein
MERKFTREPEREARVPSVGRTRVRSRGYRLERELARDLAVLVQAGLIAPRWRGGRYGRREIALPRDRDRGHHRRWGYPNSSRG